VQISLHGIFKIGIVLAEHPSQRKKLTAPPLKRARPAISESHPQPFHFFRKHFCIHRLSTSNKSLNVVFWESMLLLNT